MGVSYNYGLLWKLILMDVKSFLFCDEFKLKYQSFEESLWIRLALKDSHWDFFIFSNSFFEKSLPNRIDIIKRKRKSCTYSSCISIPLSLSPFIFVFVVPVITGEKNSRSACSGNGVGVSNTKVSTMDPLDDPKETLKVKRRKNNENR